MIFTVCEYTFVKCKNVLFQTSCPRMPTSERYAQCTHISTGIVNWILKNASSSLQQSAVCISGVLFQMTMHGAVGRTLVAMLQGQFIAVIG